MFNGSRRYLAFDIIRVFCEYPVVIMRIFHSQCIDLDFVYIGAMALIKVSDI